MREVEKYIQQFEAPEQEKLQELRHLFLEFVTEKEESIRYKMPAYKIGRYHLYFAGYKKHMGFYPVHRNTEMEAELQAYRSKTAKDALHFSYQDALPLDLIRRIIRLQMDEWK